MKKNKLTEPAGPIPTSKPAAPVDCPSCGGGLHPERLRCRGCGLALEGRFDGQPLAGLRTEEAALALEFLLCGGNLKALGERLQLSYPTVRARLDELISRLRRQQAPPERAAAPGGRPDALARKERIVALMESGEISPEAGKELLRQG
jgi:hypothetical protein